MIEAECVYPGFLVFRWKKCMVGSLVVSCVLTEQDMTGDEPQAAHQGL